MGEIEELFSWEYSYKELTKVAGKSGVTDVVEIMKGETGSEILTLKKPKFLDGELKLTKAEIGTVTHLVMQNLDFKINYDDGSIKNLINQMRDKQMITKAESEAVNVGQIVKFTESDLYLRAQRAKKIFKEQPFYLDIPVKEIYESESGESILVQGVIDLYFIDEQNNIVIVDYKTNYLEPGREEELIEKYKEQLNIYIRALEAGTQQKVKEAYIYSIYLGKEIVVFR